MQLPLSNVNIDVVKNNGSHEKPFDGLLEVDPAIIYSGSHYHVSSLKLFMR